MNGATAILRFEWVRARRDPVMRLALILFVVAAGGAALWGARWAEQRRQAVDVALAEADDIMRLRREAFVKMVARGDTPNFGLIYATALPFRAGLPNAPLAALSVGQAEGYPAAATVSPFSDPWSIFDAHAAGLESPAVLAAGRFDLAFLIVVLLPLLLIATTYDLWSHDVETGSARFQLAQPVRPVLFIVTRAAVRGGAVLVAAVAIALVWLTMVGARDAGDLAAFAIVVAAYGVSWIAMSMAINVCVRTSATAALASGTAWLVMVLLIPPAASAVADLAAPPPSAQTYTNAVRMAGLDVRAAHQPAAREAAIAQSGRAYPATLWHSRNEIQQRDARLAPIHRAHAEGLARHRALEEWLRFLSPAVAAQDALDRMAGTDAGRALAFQEQARAFAGEARQLAFTWMDDDRLLTLADYDRPLLRFTFIEPARLGPVVSDVVAVLLFGAACLVIALHRIRGGASRLL